MKAKIKRQKKAQREMQKLSLVIIFLSIVACLGAVFGNGEHNLGLIVFSCLVGAYMAMNIGANDVANNVGPAVGSKSITLLWAIVIAAICEASGAILAGSDVVNTVKSGIINPLAFDDAKNFIMLMLAALISGAIWLHFATAIGAPVSTTHSIVGGILGSGIAAGGMGVVKWSVLGSIVASWIISPLLGGIIAGTFLWFIKKTITYKQNKILAAQKIVPLLIGVMIFSFVLYLITKGLKNIIKLEFYFAYGISFTLALFGYFMLKPMILKQAMAIQNTKESVNTLFGIPLIFAAAFLSFAHGANDVANAIGPLAAINQMLGDLSNINTKASIPLWIMLIGGLGISLGLALYGPRLIRTVGREITELNKMRAFCVAMSAAITVLIASTLGLPVSSTHVTIGAIFGIGFLREYLKSRYSKMLETIQQAHGKKSELDLFMERFRKASVKRKGLMLQSLKKNKQKQIALAKKEKRVLEKFYKEELVKRSAVHKIVASWIITVPASALFSAFAYFILKISPFAF